MKLTKVFSIITMVVMLLAFSGNTIFAANATAPNIGGVTINANKVTNAGNKVSDLGNQILGIVRTVGTIAAIITLIILGIKYMMGSAEEKAEYKKTLMPYIIGAVLVLAAVNIVTWVFNAASGFFA